METNYSLLPTAQETIVDACKANSIPLRFDPGKIAVSPSAMQALMPEPTIAAVSMHCAVHNWSPAEKESNAAALAAIDSDEALPESAGARIVTRWPGIPSARWMQFLASKAADAIESGDGEAAGMMIPFVAPQFAIVTVPGVGTALMMIHEVPKAGLPAEALAALQAASNGE